MLHSAITRDSQSLGFGERRKLGRHATLLACSRVLMNGARRCDLVERARGFAHFCSSNHRVAADDGLGKVAGVGLQAALAPQVARVALGGLFDTLLR